MGRLAFVFGYSNDGGQVISAQGCAAQWAFHSDVGDARFFVWLAMGDKTSAEVERHRSALGMQLDTNIAPAACRLQQGLEQFLAPMGTAQRLVYGHAAYAAYAALGW